MSTRGLSSTWCGLTARQWEVAELVSSGFPDKLIAARLRCAVRTVEDHVSDIADAWMLDRSMNIRVLITRRVVLQCIERPSVAVA